MQGVSLQAMSIDCLNTSKHFTLVDCINTLESSSSQVRQAFSRLTQEHQSMADDWFRLIQRGWSVSVVQSQDPRPTDNSIQTTDRPLHCHRHRSV